MQLLFVIDIQYIVCYGIKSKNRFL